MAKGLQRFLPKRFRKQRTVVPVVRLTGMIAADSGGIGRKALSMATIEPLLDKAFEIKDAPVVAIEINSPGGSPVQSRLIFRRIRELAAKHDRKVLVFCEDVAASGGYMIACAGDEIIADPSSIVGSIGVVSGGFGFVDLIRRIGVERRLYTAGRNKATLDPFSPEKPEDVEHLKSLQLDVHETFIELVRERRAGRLKEDEPDLFSGQFWSARRGMELGLVDRKSVV